MSKRKYEPGSFVPCSPKHKHCSPAHAALVNSYRAERERQEKLFEVELNNPEENKIWKENGGYIVTFKSWLIATSGAGGRWQETDGAKLARPIKHATCHTVAEGFSYKCSTEKKTVDFWLQFTRT